MQAHIPVYGERERFQAKVGVGTFAFVTAILLLVLMFLSGFLWPSIQADGQHVYVPNDTRLPVNEPQYFAGSKFWLVRHSDNTFAAFYARDTARGCTLPWRGDMTLVDPGTDESRKGWFKSPCGGDVYDIDGYCISGPCQRDLDQFPVKVTVSGLIVEASEGRLIVGQERGRPRNTGIGAGSP